jgi:4'-phosphopantetheinyl transferase
MTSAHLLMVDAHAVADADLPRLRDWLSAGEQARCQRFVRAERLRQFVIGRVLARMALGRVLAVPAREVVLEEQVAGAPLLVAPVVPGVAPGFSISHSGRWVACAVSAAPRDLAALAQQAFDADEMRQWEALPPVQRVDGFYRMWSTKEARFKLGREGHSIAIAHDALSVVVCSAAPLAAPPVIELVALP